MFCEANVAKIQPSCFGTVALGMDPKVRPYKTLLKSAAPLLDVWKDGSAVYLKLL